MRVKQISSSANPAFKEAVRLRRKKRRYENRLFLAEGEDLLEAALAGGHIPRQVFVVEESAGAITDALDNTLIMKPDTVFEPEVFSCNETVMGKLSALGSGSRVIAVFDFIDRPLSDLDAGDIVQDNVPGRPKGPLVYLAGVRDPGNAGTLVRSAAALGASGVIFSPDAADPFSDKAQRAAMGAVFQIPLYLQAGREELVAWARSSNLPIICADPAEGIPPWEIDDEGQRLLVQIFVLVLGSEREGLPQELASAADLRLRIPQMQVAESLNVAMAGTIILYEALRQRREE